MNINDNPKKENYWGRRAAFSLLKDLN